MQDYLEALKLEKPKVFAHQIRDTMRELLLSGKFAPGDRIPSLRNLAAAWGTNPSTVDAALAVLEKEGLLVRHHGKGTFVQKRNEKLTCVGVYSRTTNDAPFAHAVREMVKQELHSAGIEMDVWVDSRPIDRHDTPWEPLVKAAEQRRIQAFIGVETDIPLLKWQQRLSVPSAFLGGLPSLPNCVNVDPKQMVEISLRELARQGCRSVGVIAPVMDADRFAHPDGSHNAWLGALEHFTTVAVELGLVMKNEWMRLLAHHEPGVKGQERFGYEEFLNLWSQPEKPEGLLILNDVSARGALMAMCEKHVRVPEELKLVLQKNESIDLFCPMSATFVVASEREVARALIGQVQKQFRGESCEPISLPFKLVAHNNP